MESVISINQSIFRAFFNILGQRDRQSLTPLQAHTRHGNVLTTRFVAGIMVHPLLLIPSSEISSEIFPSISNSTILWTSAVLPKWILTACIWKGRANSANYANESILSTSTQTMEIWKYLFSMNTSFVTRQLASFNSAMLHKGNTDFAGFTEVLPECEHQDPMWSQSALSSC